MIEVKNLSKQFGSLKALSDINFTINRNEVVAIIGPNGAGKTTLFRILSTLLPFRSGEIRIADLDLGRKPQAVRSKIGAVFADPALYDRLTPFEETLFYFGTLYGLQKPFLIERIEQLMEVVSALQGPPVKMIKTNDPMAMMAKEKVDAVVSIRLMTSVNQYQVTIFHSTASISKQDVEVLTSRLDKLGKRLTYQELKRVNMDLNVLNTIKIVTQTVKTNRQFIEKGLRVLRINNREIEMDLPDVLQRIFDACVEALK